MLDASDGTHICQVHNKKPQRECTLLSGSRPGPFCEVDVKAATALAAEVWQTKAATEAFEVVREQRNPLENVPSTLNMADMHAKAQYMLKDTLGVTLARVVMIDHQRQQLRVTGERCDSYYPLTAKSIIARVLHRGTWELLRKPAADPDFNASIDCNGGPPPEDMLVVPVPAAPEMVQDSSRPPSSHSQSASASKAGEHSPTRIIAVIQVHGPAFAPSFAAFQDSSTVLAT